MVGTDDVKILTDFEPSEIAPRGAVMWARFVETPSTGFVSCPPPGWEPEERYDGPAQKLSLGPLWNRLLEPPPVQQEESE